MPSEEPQTLLEIEAPILRPVRDLLKIAYESYPAPRGRSSFQPVAVRSGVEYPYCERAQLENLN